MGLMYGVLMPTLPTIPQAAGLGRAADAAVVDGGELRRAASVVNPAVRERRRLAVVRAVAVHLRRRGGDRLHAVRTAQAGRWPACSAASPAGC